VLKSTRDKEAKAAAREAKAGTAAVTQPSNAAKPKTDAPETNPTIKSPSKAKTAPAAEQSKSVAPAMSAKAANLAEPSVEKTVKQRNGKTGKSEPAAAYKAPETLKGEPIGAARAKGDAAAPGQAVSIMAAPAVRPKPSLGDRNRPAAIEKPTVVDDLKLISGVGPKIEGTLHSLGIYTFAQVASWKKAERDWVDGYLNFKGRIDRDDWVKQAKALAKGGVAEYVRVFGKKPV
jgi:NADH-quinone oxidoreductase subunit E